VFWVLAPYDIKSYFRRFGRILLLLVIHTKEVSTKPKKIPSNNSFCCHLVSPMNVHYYRQC